MTGALDDLEAGVGDPFGQKPGVGHRRGTIPVADDYQGVLGDLVEPTVARPQGDGYQLPPVAKRARGERGAGGIEIVKGRLVVVAEGQPVHSGAPAPEVVARRRGQPDHR